MNSDTAASRITAETPTLEVDHARLGPYDDMLPAYVRWGEPMSRSVAEKVLDKCVLPPGAQVLDVCAGTGALTALAAERGHAAQGIDVSPLSVTYLAGRLLPYANCRSVAMDAASTFSYPSGWFDAAFSIFGVTFLGPAVASSLSEMLRVVRPDGTVAIAHWANEYGGPLFEILIRASRDVPDAIPEPFTAPMEYLKRDELAGALTGAGLVDVRVEPLPVNCSLPAAEDFLWELNPMFRHLPGFRSLTFAQRARLDAAAVERVHRIEAGAEAPPTSMAHVAYGRVPGGAHGDQAGSSYANSRRATA